MLVRGGIEKPFRPEPVFVENRNNRVLQLTIIGKVYTTIIRRGVALPDRTVLTSVIKLNEQRTRAHIKFLRVVIALALFALFR